MGGNMNLLVQQIIKVDIGLWLFLEMVNVVLRERAYQNHPGETSKYKIKLLDLCSWLSRNE